MLYNKFKVVGLQRTGTNWLNELIKENFVVEPDVGTFWKHMTPLGVNQMTFKKFQHGRTISNMDLKNFILDDNTFYIATSKDYNIWLESLERNPEDFYITHSTKSTKDVYNAWYNWKKHQLYKKNFIYHNYVQWLNNWEDYLEDIHNITKWKKKHRYYVNVNNVPRSSNFNLNNYKGLQNG